MLAGPQLGDCLVRDKASWTTCFGRWSIGHDFPPVLETGLLNPNGFAHVT